MKRNDTARGFARYEFTDRYDHRCSLQKSSLATEDAIWFGMDDPDLQEIGWHPEHSLRARTYALPKGVEGFSRMHLTRDQVADLLPALQHFVEFGELPEATE